MNQKKWLKIGGTLLGILFLVNAAGSIVGDPIDGVFPEIKKLAGYDRQDLLYLSGGYSNSLLGRSAEAEFQIKGEDDGKTIRISVHKPLHLLPWQVRTFETTP
ncbi:hypothetical protein N9D23_14410 [Rubripirellula sp.]|nr:hypothetical protein [Rubripirellula sp.]